MAETPIQNQFYQAPLEVPGYVNPSVSKIPSQPVDLYGLFNVFPPAKTKLQTRAKNPYEMMMEGDDPYAGLIPDTASLQTNLKTLDPLDDSAGLFHSQDGFGKYGYSTILHGGDNENRYAQNFRADNPNKFYSGANPFKLLYRGLYWTGGFLEKTLESAAIKTGQGIAGLYGMTIGNTIGLAQGENYGSFEDWLSKSSDNVFSNVFNGWDEKLKERYHYFQEKSDRDKKGFIQSLGDGDFWMNDISDGLGFLVSAAFEVGLISKLGLGTKAATRLSPLAEGVSTEALAANAVATGNVARTGLQKTMNLLGVEGSGHMFIKNAVDLTSQTLALTAIESAVEANEVKNKVYTSFEGRVNPETGYYYTEEEKKRLSAAAAAETFKQNMSILIGPKFLETLVFNRIGKFAKNMFNKTAAEAETAAGRASGSVRSRLGNLSSGTSYNKTSNLANVMKTGSAAALGFVSEGLFEENIQLAISRTAEETFGGSGEFYRPGTSEKAVDKLQQEDELFGNVGKRYIEQTKQFFQGVGDSRMIDDELSKSIGIGGAFGIVGGAIHSTIGARKQAKIDYYWNNRLNSATANLFQSGNFYATRTEERADPNNPGKTKPTEVIITDPKTGQPVLDQGKLMTFLNKMGNIQGLMDIVTNTEDPNDENNNSYQNKELNKLARNVLFTQLAMEYVRAGKGNLLKSTISSASGFSDKDITALGYEPGMMTDQEKKNMLEKMTNIVDRLTKADEWIENNVLNNVSEEREGKFGLSYSKAQKQKRLENFEKKKAYLRGLSMQNILLDTYLDDISQQEQGLGEPGIEILSSALDENGMVVTDFSVPLATVSRNFNSRIPALRNQIAVLEKEFAYHWDNMSSHERNSPKGQKFNAFSKTNNGVSLTYNQIKAEEALEKMNSLQSELDDLVTQRNAFLNNDKAFELREEDGEFYIFPKTSQQDDMQRTIEQLNADKIRRINAVKKEEIGIQKGWINEEWKQVAALKEEKTKAEREDTYFSRRMTLSRNAYNTYFEREVMDKDNSLGQRKMKLFDKDPNKRVSAKKYKANEEKLLKAVRIQGKVQSILADVNGQKLIAELSALLNKDLPSQQFTEELTRITDIYNGKLMIVSARDKNLVDGQIADTVDENAFVGAIFEFMPEDDRFNEKYYDIGINGEFVVKPEYDGLQELAVQQRILQDRIDDLGKIKKFLNSIPESIPGDWNNTNVVKKRIADVYTETADSIINLYNQMSNNGASEIAGDSLSTKQDLDLIDQEIDELGQLKVIFEDRTKNDKILDAPEFTGFIEAIDKRIEDLKKIREIVKERLSSRLRENQDFLIDAINNQVEQLGLNFDGSTQTEPIKNVIERVVTPEIYSKLQKSLADLKILMDKEDQTADDKKAIADAYWNISGQVAAIQEMIKKNDRNEVLYEAFREKRQQIQALKATALMQELKDESYYQQIVDNIDDSLLGVLQIIFYQSKFSQVGVAGDTDSQFLDDQPASPVYKFREDYNLRKLLRATDRDTSRTSENTEVSKEALQEFLAVAKKIQNMEDLTKSLQSNLNMLDQIEKEKQVVQAKINKKDNQYENLIVPSIQQLYFIRAIASFLRRNTGGKGFRNWTYIQAPGGAGKTQTLGTWFNAISGIPRDRVLATAFTEEAARGIKKALLVGEEGPKDASEMIDYINELIKNKQFDHDVLIIDEFPAIDVQTQKGLFEAISKYTELKLAQNKGEFKVITMGDTNQLTFTDNGSVTPRPTIIINPNFFNNNKAANNDNHPAKMTIIPSLTVNFRSNLFAITSFIDQFKGSNKDNVNATLKVASTDPDLNTKNAKGVVSIEKGAFGTKVLAYLKLNPDSVRTRALIVNETKLESYKKMLSDNGIKIITDPNDEVTKGVYVTTVKNSQGFSFDEVFVDLENKDKTLFSGTSSPEFIYNKAMYVAASRARNLIVVTNFPNFENITDDSINTLENKALEELQTKDADFVAQRDLEITGGKFILGSQYNTTVQTVTPVKSTEKEESAMDVEDETDTSKEQEEEENETEDQEKTEEESKKPLEEEEIIAEDENLIGQDETSGNQVVSATGAEDQQSADVAETEKTYKQISTDMWNKIKDKTITAFTKIRDGIVEILFPTGSTVKFKIGDGVFTTTADEFENRNLQAGDRVVIVPFQQSKTAKSPRKFGYAAITPAITADGSEIPNSWRTVSVLSDTEIDRLKESPKTKPVYDAITQNETKDKGFINLLYTDVSDVNGFTTSAGKTANDLAEGVVSHANPIKYFFNKAYKDMNKSTMDEVITAFIDSFYANHISSFPEAQRETEYKKIKKFYENSENAQIIIPVKADVEGKKPNLKIPPELRTYVQAGRPYLAFKPFHRRSSMQFIALSRKFLDTKAHNTQLAPIREFIQLGKNVRALLEKKGITEKMGYSKSLSNMLSKLANDYVKTPNENSYKAVMFSTVDGKRTSKEVTFSNAEAERIYNLFALYSEPNTQMLKAQTEKEIENLTKVKRARNYTFEDGETIYGLIESYDPSTKTFVVKDIRSGETSTKSGVISHTGKSYVGQAQQALDDIMNSNGSVASRFTSTTGSVGFVTNKSRTKEDVYIGYKFMGLLGSKTAPVAKSYNEDGTPKENFADVIEILESLFNFGVSGELPGKQLNILNNERKQESIEVKFRVPVPLNARDENGELEYDYTNSPQNTSRDSSISNSRFFESNFDTMLPTRVFVDFTEQVKSQTSAAEDRQEDGQNVQVNVQVESPVIDTKNWTKEDINTLSFSEIENRLSPEDKYKLDVFAKASGWSGIDEMFDVLKSSIPSEQALFRDYLIECLL